MMLAEIVQNAKHLVVFTGAGMSTESGLPDFRSADKGLWTTEQKSYLSSTDALNNHLEDFIAFYRERVLGVSEYKPNKGHLILADWEARGLLKGIITQNVDGFHGMAGNKKIAELHGTLQKLHCQQCGKTYSSREYLHGIYKCNCGGTLRPSIVLFGEMLPSEAFLLAEDAAIQSDVFIVIGSSLNVSPANQLPLLANETGSKLIIINKERTEYDHLADLVLHESIGKVLNEIDKELAGNR